MNSFTRDLLAENLASIRDVSYEDDLCLLKSAETIVIWGAGALGECALIFCSEHGIVPECFVDNRADITTYLELPVLPADKFFLNYPPSTLILIACSERGANEIREQLYGHEYRHTVTYYAEYWFGIGNITANRALIYDNAATIDALAGSFADEKSRRVFANILRYRLSFVPHYLLEISDENQYLNNDVISSFNGSFVDCGAFDGDTLKYLLDWENGSYDRYYAFEPDEKAYRLLSDYTAALKNVYIENTGLWNKNDVLYFSNSGSTSSRLTEAGGLKIRVSSIDALLKDADHVDFIKMDIEGAEMEALQGAVKTIQKYKPVLAICIYHKPKHLWEIPAFIAALNPQYRIYIRHYSKTPNETVCYAVI